MPLPQARRVGVRGGCKGWVSLAGVRGVSQGWVSAPGVRSPCPGWVSGVGVRGGCQGLVAGVGVRGVSQGWVSAPGVRSPCPGQKSVPNLSMQFFQPFRASKLRASKLRDYIEKTDPDNLNPWKPNICFLGDLKKRLLRSPRDLQKRPSKTEPDPHFGEFHTHVGYDTGTFQSAVHSRLSTHTARPEARQ